MATKKTVYETPTPASDKKKALQTALAQIDKNFGKGTVMRLGDRPEMNVEAIPTGSLALDAAVCPREELSRSMAQNPPARRPWPFTSWLRPRSGAARLHSWTRSML